MKYAKTAALLAGSVAALGAAAPAFAVTETPTAPVFSLDTGLNQVMASGPQVVDPLVETAGQATEVVGGAAGRLQEDGTVDKVAGQATGAVEDAAPALIGGLPLGR
ncbi:hypothetical protein [uncultured Streptomyces sp.]|uniref:hypothetical protein n=1 Tax=uncultured Streptomyces sp. TaxID=174707 RepID=UPI00262A6610|nr:hypothetical protein [uncultured Streptomyces sp.]